MSFRMDGHGWSKCVSPRVIVVIIDHIMGSLGRVNSAEPAVNRGIVQLITDLKDMAQCMQYL
jgi:hypothetical protein